MRVLSSIALGILLAATVVGCGASAPENEYETLQQSIAAAEGRLNAAGKVEKKMYPPGPAWSVNLEGATIDEQMIADINTVERVSELLVSGAKITDEQLQTLLESGQFTYLNVLDVSNTPITDAGLAGLEEKKYLQKLDVKGSGVTEGFITRFQSARKGNAEIGQQFKTVKVTK